MTFHPDTPLPDVLVRLSACNLLRLRASGISTVEHLEQASAHTLKIALRRPQDRAALIFHAREAGIEIQLHEQH